MLLPRIALVTSPLVVLLAATPAGAAEQRLRLVPPRLIEDIVLAQDYDEAYDEEEEETEETTKEGSSSGEPKRKRNRSSSAGSSSSQQRTTGTTSSGTSPVFSGGAGGVAPMGRQIGVGLQIGAPTAITGKFMLMPDQGLVVGLGAGWGFFFHPALSLHVDYLWHPMVLAANETFALSWFIGGGLWLGLYNGNNQRYLVGFDRYPFYYVYSPLLVAVRVPIGLSFALNAIPLEFYLEGVPAFAMLPSIGFGIGVAGGARFYF